MMTMQNPLFSVFPGLIESYQAEGQLKNVIWPIKKYILNTPASVKQVLYIPKKIEILK